MPIRETDYAICLSDARHSQPEGNEIRIERLEVKEHPEEHEIRFSWWKDGKLMPRALDLSERELLVVMRKALRQDDPAAIFDSHFLFELAGLINAELHRRHAPVAVR